MLNELEKWEIREKNLREIKQGFESILHELETENNFTPETQDRQFVQIAVTSVAIAWATDELHAAQNMIQHYKQGGN